MSDDDSGEREHGNEVSDPPRPRHRVVPGKDDAGADEAEQEGAFEATEETRHLFEEGDVLHFLGRGAPRHVDLEEVAQKRLGHVQRTSAEEDGEEGYPFEVLADWGMCQSLFIFGMTELLVTYWLNRDFSLTVCSGEWRGRHYRPR